MAAPRTADARVVGQAIRVIEAACQAGRLADALHVLAELVPEFPHESTPLHAPEIAR